MYYEEAKTQSQLLRVYRNNLRHWYQQADAHGGLDYAPPLTRNGINECVSAIRRIKGVLREAGYPVSDEENEDTYV